MNRCSYITVYKTELLNKILLFCRLAANGFQKSRAGFVHLVVLSAKSLTKAGEIVVAFLDENGKNKSNSTYCTQYTSTRDEINKCTVQRLPQDFLDSWLPRCHFIAS